MIELKSIVDLIENHSDWFLSEEQAKVSLVMPFLRALGYEVENPTEVRYEFTADFGAKNNDKCDLAVIIDGKPVILIECKQLNTALTDSAASQLSRYYNNTTEAKVGILTNGRIYRFYSDLINQNVMDAEPFFTIDLTTMDSDQIAGLELFTKGTYRPENINIVARQSYERVVNDYLVQQSEFADPEFVQFLTRKVFNGNVNSTDVLPAVESVMRKLVGKPVEVIPQLEFTSDFETYLSWLQDLVANQPGDYSQGFQGDGKAEFQAQAIFEILAGRST